MKNFFLSLKTTVWTLTALIALFFVGSYLMPVHRGVFGPMNEMLLFVWLRDLAAANPGQTWWFFACLALLVLLTLNTIVCSIHAVKGKWSRSEFLLRISPQVMHAGFLLILLAHLLGAGWGYRLSGVLPEGASVRLPEERVLHLRSIWVRPDRSGFIGTYGAEIRLYQGGVLVASGTLGPNEPVFHRGTGVYLKSFDLDRGPSAFLLVTRDPGALWALAGGLLFTLGALVLLVLKWKHA